MSNIQTKPRIRKEPDGEWYIAVKSTNREVMRLAQSICNTLNWNLFINSSKPMKLVRSHNGFRSS